MKPENSRGRCFRPRRRGEDVHQQRFSTTSAVLYVRSDFVLLLRCLQHSDTEKQQDKHEPHDILHGRQIPRIRVILFYPGVLTPFLSISMAFPNRVLKNVS